MRSFSSIHVHPDNNLLTIKIAEQLQLPFFMLGNDSSKPITSLIFNFLKIYQTVQYD